jgi:hypothetical protein
MLVWLHPWLWSNLWICWWFHKWLHEFPCHIFQGDCNVGIYCLSQRHSFWLACLRLCIWGLWMLWGGQSNAMSNWGGWIIICPSLLEAFQYGKDCDKKWWGKEVIKARIQVSRFKRACWVLETQAAVFCLS